MCDKLQSKHLAAQPNQPDALKHMRQTCVKGVVSTRGAPGRHRNVGVFDLHTSKVPAVPTTNRRPQNETAHVWTCMCVDKKLCLYTRHWKLCPDSKMNEKRHLHQPRRMILGTSWSNRCNFPGQPIESKYDHSNLKKTPCLYRPMVDYSLQCRGMCFWNSASENISQASPSLFEGTQRVRAD